MSRYERELQEKIWKKVLEFYRSDPPTRYPTTDWKVQINRVYSWFESIWPSLTFMNPHFTCTPMTESSVSSNKTTEAAINAELRGIDFKKFVEKAVFDALLPGLGILKMGFYGGNGRIAGPVEQASDEVAPITADKHNSDLPYGLRPDQAYVEHIRPDRFLIDPNAASLDEALWVGHEYVRDLDALKLDKQYQNTDNLFADEYEYESDLDVKDYRKTYGEEPEITRVRIIEIWDIVKRKVLVFTMGHDRFLGRHEWNLPFKRFPYYVIHGTEDRHYFWNQGPTVPWLSLVNELNLSASNRIDHMSRNKAKIVYREGAFDEAELDNFIEARTFSMLGADIPENSSIANSIAPVPLQNLPTDEWAHIAETGQRLTEISGQSEFDLGGTRPGERSATEVDRTSGGADIKRFGLGSRITKPLECLAYDFRSLLEKYYPKSRVVQIIGDHGEAEWVPWDGEGLRGEYMFTVNLEDLAPQSRDQRAQSAGLMLQLLTPYSQVASPVPRIDIDLVLRKAAEDLNMTPFMRFYPQVGPPMGPDREWFLLVNKGMDIQPNEQDDHQWHLFTHEIQAQHPLTLQDPAAVERMRTHTEMHQAMRLSQQMAQQGAQQSQQQSAGGTPGPNQGSASNNQSGGAGPFSGSGVGGGGATQGGAQVGNLQSLLRGGAQ